MAGCPAGGVERSGGHQYSDPRQSGTSTATPGSWADRVQSQRSTSGRTHASAWCLAVGRMPVVFGTVTRRPVSSEAKIGPGYPTAKIGLGYPTAKIGPVSSEAKRAPARRGARRALTLAVLTVLTVPLFSAAAFAADGDGRIGTKYNPDPLSALDTWLIYGGTIVGGFLLAFILTALSSRKSSKRYRPGRPWQHDSVWVGGEPPAGESDDPSKEPAGTVTPGSGGASGKW